MINNYLESHSLKDKFVRSLGWTWEEDGNTITIPVYDQKGKLSYCRYRHLEGRNKFSTDTGAHPSIYCIHKIKDVKDIILCEGEPDCARLWQEGIPAVTGTSGVKTFSIKLAEQLIDKNITLCLDTDEAGQSSIENYYNVLSEVGISVKIKELPKEYKDISEYFTAGFSKEDFEALPTFSFEEWLDKNEPEQYKFETVTDILSQKIPPDEWLVNRMIPAEGFTFLVGAEATGKSFYALSLAQAVATATPWTDAKKKDSDEYLFNVSKPKKVLVIDKENTKRRVQSRLKWMGIDSPNIYYLKFPHYFELSDPTEEDGFSKIAKAASRKVKAEGIKFIVVDSFTDVMIGNENAAGDVQKFFDAFRQLFEGCSILVLHHASKPSQGVVRTSAQRTRGSTNINAQVYSMFYVEALQKSKTEFVIEQTKAGDAEKLNRFIVQLKVEQIGNTDKTKVTGIEYKGEVPDEEMKLQEAIKQIEEAFIATSQMSLSDLVDVLQSNGISNATCRRAIKEMIDDGTIQKIQDPDNKAKKLVVWGNEQSSNALYED